MSDVFRSPHFLRKTVCSPGLFGAFRAVVFSGNLTPNHHENKSATDDNKSFTTCGNYGSIRPHKLIGTAVVTNLLMGLQSSLTTAATKLKPYLLQLKKSREWDLDQLVRSISISSRETNDFNEAESSRIELIEEHTRDAFRVSSSRPKPVLVLPPVADDPTCKKCSLSSMRSYRASCKFPRPRNVALGPSTA